jgi:hypothetical protein
VGNCHDSVTRLLLAPAATTAPTSSTTTTTASPPTPAGSAKTGSSAIAGLLGSSSRSTPAEGPVAASLRISIRSVRAVTALLLGDIRLPI